MACVIKKTEYIEFMNNRFDQGLAMAKHLAEK